MHRHDDDQKCHPAADSGGNDIADIIGAVTEIAPRVFEKRNAVEPVRHQAAGSGGILLSQLKEQIDRYPGQADGRGHPDPAGEDTGGDQGKSEDVDKGRQAGAQVAEEERPGAVLAEMTAQARKEIDIFRRPVKKIEKRADDKGDQPDEDLLAVDGGFFLIYLHGDLPD